MRFRYLWVLVCLSMWSGSLAQTHILTNGGFEQLDSNYFPVDWSPVGDGVVVSPEAHTGRYSLRIQRSRKTPMPPETGLNRGWRPGTLGAMLDVRKGVVRVYYRVLSAATDASMSVVVIPMGEPGIENTGEPRTQRFLPNDAAGDGQWHETKLAYDYSGAPAVKWVHIGIRIVGGAADLLVDDFELLAGEMAILQIEKVHFYPDDAASDRAGTLQACVSNVGSAPSGTIGVTLEMPQGLTADGPAAAGPLPPGGATTLRWRVRGRLSTCAIRIHADEGTSRETAVARLVPRAELLMALASPGLARPGGPVKITATVWNRGTALATGYSVGLKESTGAMRRTARLAAIPPGGRSSVTFHVSATGRPGDVKQYRCVLQGLPAGQPEQSWPVRVSITDAVVSPRSLSVGPVTIRSGTDRTVAHLMRVQGKTAALVGVMPHLGRVTVRLPSGGTQLLTARYALPRVATGAVKLVTTQVDRAGGRWTFRAELRPLSADAIRVQTSVQCSASRKVVAFEGPTLLVGEGADGERKIEGIFPGLEWLTGDEVSSSDLDIIASHPDRPRFAPHPNKVTIPAMAVQTPTATTALYWDAYAKWDGTHDRPQPVFASPDRIEGRAGHLMGLIAPSAAHGWPENGVVTSHQYAMDLAAGQTLTLSGVLAVTPSDRSPITPGALAGIVRWFRFYTPSKPARAPQGSDNAQIAWSMRAYMETLWDKEGRGWLPYLNGPAIWRKPSFDPSYAYDLLEATRILPAKPQAAEWRSRLDLVRQHTTPMTQDELSFAEGDPLSTIRGHAWSMASLMGQQAADGSYAFDADRRDEGVFRGYDYHELGKPGEVEIGLVARNAYLLLRMARITGDQRLWEAGVRSLRRMRAFRVPRAAQVWEVPVHTPDILASADAVEAYLEAYRVSGNREWLADAKRWAMTGLPFVYVWNAPGKLWMRWGSIPVFGASQMRGSWFGNIVQWNGLRYAGAILKLHAYDPETSFGGLSWRDIAIGITRCAMYQQSNKKEILTLWPDSYHTITDVRAAWDFAPRLILKNVYAYLGRSEEPETVRVAGPGGAVARVTTLGSVTGAGWKSDALSFVVRHPKGMRGSVAVLGVSRPKRVQIGAAPVPEVAQDLYTDRACWRYDAAVHGLVIRLPSDAPSQIRITGIEPAATVLIPRLATHLRFTFDDDDEGWTPEHDVAGLVVRDGTLQGTSSGPDPYVVRANCRFDGQTVQRVIVRLRSDRDGGGQFYWTTASEPSFAEDKVFNFPVRGDGQWHEIELPVGQHERWKGQTITAIRLDPINASGVSFAVDWIEGR